MQLLHIVLINRLLESNNVWLVARQDIRQVRQPVTPATIVGHIAHLAEHVEGHHLGHIETMGPFQCAQKRHHHSNNRDGLHHWSTNNEAKKKEKKKRKRLILLGWIERNEAEKRYQRETTSPLERFFGAISYRVRSTTSVCASGFKVGWELRKKEKKKAF